MRSLVELRQLHAIDRAGPRGRSRGRLFGVDLALGSGVHTFVGTPEDGGIALIEALTGAHPPLRGSARIAGHDPHRSPAVRARLGTLTWDDGLADAPTVAAAVRLALEARGEPPRVDALLDAFGLAALRARNPRSLGASEARAIELALALTTPAPNALALYEPFSDVAIAIETVRARLLEIASAGAAVLVVTSSWLDARAFGGAVYALERGRVRGPLDEAEATGIAELVVTLAAEAEDGVRIFVALLAQRHEVASLSWEPVPAAGADRGGGYFVRVAGPDLGACALAVSAAAIQSNVRVDSIATAPVTASRDGAFGGPATSAIAAPFGAAPSLSPAGAPVTARFVPELRR